MNEYQTPPRKRRRPALSCVQCRRRKIKCDRNTPCNNCMQSKKAATCCYNPVEALSPTTVSSRERTTNAPTAQSASSSRGTSDHTIDSLDPRETDFSRTNFPSSRIVPFPENTQHGRDSKEPESTVLASYSDTAGVQELRNRVHELEQRLSNSSGEQLPDSGVAHPAPQTVMGAHGNMSKTRFFGEGHWMNSCKQVQTWCSQDDCISAERKSLTG